MGTVQVKDTMTRLQEKGQVLALQMMSKFWNHARDVDLTIMVNRLTQKKRKQEGDKKLE